MKSISLHIYRSKIGRYKFILLFKQPLNYAYILNNFRIYDI